MTHDRNYLRMCDDITLIRMADTAPDDLTLVLAERLAELQDIGDECDTLRDALDERVRQVDILRDELQDSEDEIERLRGLLREADQ